jgi:aminopeptidase N
MFYKFFRFHGGLINFSKLTACNYMKLSFYAISAWLMMAILLPAIQAGAQAVTDTNGLSFHATREKQAFSARQQADPAYRTSAASSNFDVYFYRCEWQADPAIRFIRGKVSSFFTISTATDKIVFDLSDTLVIDSITFRGKQVPFLRPGNDALEIQFPAALNAGEKESVSIYYYGVPRLSRNFNAFTQSQHSGTPILWTLSEPFGAKEWWPCKNGLNDKADSIDIIITHPAGWQAASNGLMVKDTAFNGNIQSYWKHRYPIASYLVAFAISNYVVLKDTVTVAGRVVNLVDYAYPEFTAYFNQQRIFTRQALTLYSDLFGLYPFANEKYGFTQFSGSGGMEHQTNSFVTSPGMVLIEHETAHQWFGDKITCGSWEDIWLNEGLATYCQVLFNQYIDTTNYIPILRNMTRDIAVAPDGSVKVSDTTNGSRIFSTRLSYYKGAFLFHMLRWKLGDDAFFRGMKRYINDPLLQYNFARTPDLKRNLEAESGQNLNSFFQKWYYGEGFPSYNCTWTQNLNNWASVKINQTTSHPSVDFYDMPVQLQFKNAVRDTLITVNHQRNGEIFWVNPGFAADTLLVDPYYRLLAAKRVSARTPLSSVLQDDIRVYPNPAPHNLYITVMNPTSKRLTLQLYNTAGQLIYRKDQVLNGSDETVDISLYGYAAGTYVLLITDDKNRRTRKLIVH